MAAILRFHTARARVLWQFRLDVVGHGVRNVVRFELRLRQHEPAVVRLVVELAPVPRLADQPCLLP